MKKKCFLMAIVLALGLSYTVASATLVTFNNNYYTTADQPALYPGSLIMSFNDNDISGAVTLTVEYTPPPASSTDPYVPYVNVIYFNTTNLSIGINPNSGVSISSDAYKADGDGNFDVKIEFPQSDANRFTSGQVLFNITGTGITALTFNGTSVGGAIPFNTAAHIAALSGGASTWIGSTEYSGAPPVVPIPAAAWLLGTGLIGLVVIRRRMKK